MIEPELPDLPENDHGKIAKSVRKKAEKAAAKRMRAEEVQAREEKMEKQRQKDDERAALRDEKQRERERMEAEEEEEERKKRELELAQEEAEFKDWEGMFELESAGSGEADAKEQEGGLSAFIDNIKKQKVVVLDDLAAEYGMRTTAVVNRIEHLEKAGQLTGVLDDRGKFIYITPEELEAVAKFIEEKGRVTIADVVQESNRLIDLTEKNEIVLDEEDDEEEEAQAQTQ